MQNELTEFERESEQDFGKPLKLEIRNPSKRNIEIAAYHIIQRVEDGEENAVEVAIRLSAIEKMCEYIRKGIQRQVLDELAKTKGETVMFSAKVVQKETGVKYDYTESTAWKKISEIEKGYAEKRKEIETVAKTIPDGSELNYPDPETGEQLIIKKAAKSSETNFAVTLPK